MNDAFPRIGNNLKEYWGRQEFVSYVRNLLHDNRGSSRQGFPLDVLMALQEISDLHAAIYPGIVPKDMLKIDQSFVRDMLEDPDDLAILQGIIGLAESFKRQVIAEGVETCLLYTSPSPRDRQKSRMPSSA